MILSTAEHYVESSTLVGWIHAEIELPSSVVQVYVGRTKDDPKRMVILQVGITVEHLGGLLRWDGGTERTRVIFDEVEVLKRQITANHVVPFSLDGFIGCYTSLPCLCGDIYAPIDPPCSACAVAQDLAFEADLIEWGEGPMEGQGPYLRWKGGALRGGRVLPRETGGWDWARPGRDENVFSSLVVDESGGVRTVFSVPPGTSIPHLRGWRAKRKRKCKKLGSKKSAGAKRKR